MSRTKSEKVEHMSRVPLFEKLSRRQLDKVARYTDEISVPAGAMLAREGEIGRELLVIVEGKARVDRGAKTVATLADGDFVGEMALIDGLPRSATVVAETPMVVLTIDGRAFRQIVDDMPSIKDKLLVTLCARLRAADEALVD